VVKSEAAQRRRGVKGLFWFVRVIQIPDVGLLRHVRWHLLEAKLGVGGCNALVRAAVGVPADLGHGALNLVWIFENHNGLGADDVRGVFRLFAIEVLFEEVDLIVLPDAVAGSVGELGGGHLEAEVYFSQHLLLVLGDIEGLGVIEFLGPA